MVQFPRFRLTAPYGPRCRAFDSSTGYPIRPSTDLRMFAPTRGFSQLTTAFLAKQLQGIHRRPLPACHITHLPFPVSDDRCKDPVDQRRHRRRAGVRCQHTFVKDPSSQKDAQACTARASVVIVSISSAAAGDTQCVRRGGMGTRTPDLWLAKPSLWPPELYPPAIGAGQPALATARMSVRQDSDRRRRLPPRRSEALP